MNAASTLDNRVFGQRLRHFRRQRGLTLGALGALVGRPASYLSQLENGHREPRLSTVNQLAAALGVGVPELLDATPPNRRAELEVALAEIQEDPLYRDLKLPYLRPTAKLDDTALEHIVALHRAARSATGAGGGGAGPVADRAASGSGSGSVVGPARPSGDPPVVAAVGDGVTDAVGGARAANAAMRDEMRRRDNYFEEIEKVCGDALRAVGYTGPGAVSERNLTDLAGYFGFRIARTQDLPTSTRSITDQRQRVIYVPQRNNATVRTARSVIAQTLGHFALGHSDPPDFDGYVRQRVEANYFAGALLAPEDAVVRMLRDAKDREDLSVEDLNEVFYISYETAAHRMTNLLTRHLGIPVHFQRSDPEGRLWKAYENDGVLLPADADGTIEGQRVCRWWSARQAFESEDSFATYHQYTETQSGTYWCATHVEVAAGRGDAVTLGTVAEHARWFRGSETARRATSRCPDPSCCREPPSEQVARWSGAVWPSARDHSHFVSGLPTDTVVFDAFPGVDLTDVYSFMDRHAGR